MKALNTILSSRLAAYAAAGAAVAITGTAATSHAAVVTFDPPDISIPNTIDGVYINFVTHATGTSASAVPGFDFDPYSSGTALLFYWGGAGALNFGLSLDGVTYAKLAPGATVGPAGTYIQTANGSNGETANFLTGGTGYLGVKFFNEANSTTDYGYVHLTTTTGSGFPATILDWGYEDTGAAITIPSAVPEPTTTAIAAVGALALGAQGLRRWRQQRAATV